MTAPSEISAERVARIYATLSSAYEAIVRIRERRPLFAQICTVLVEQGRLRMAWIGEIDDHGWVVPVAHAGAVKGYLDDIRISVLDIPVGRGPTGIAVRERRHMVTTDIAADERMEPWRDAALARGLRSSAGFPLVVDDRCVAVLTAYASEPEFFDEQQVELLDRMTADLSFALQAMERDERRRAVEAQLRASEEQFRIAVESMLDTVTLVSPVRDKSGEIVDFRVKFANEAYCALAGVDRERLIGHRLGEQYPQFPGSGRFELYRRVAATHQPCRTDGVTDAHAWGGSALVTRVLDTIIAPIGEDLIVSGRDVTERKRAEEKLAYTTSLLERTQEISRTGGWEYDVASATNRWTEELYRIFGREAASGAPHPLEATASYDADSAPRIRAAFERLVGQGEPYDLELGLNRPDGQKIWVRTIGRPVREHGAIVRVGGAVADVTERHDNERALRRAREELELAQRIAELGSFSADAGLQTMAWSAELFRILGRNPDDGAPSAAELLGHVHPDDVEVVRAAFEGVLAGRAQSELDFRVRARDDTERVVHAIVRRDPERPGSCSGIVQDVTRVRATERALREQSARAESASRAKSEFLARMSHELRTPLNSIIGFSQLLELEGLDQRQSEHVAYVLKAGGHLLELINEVLELAKIEAGQTTVSPEPVLLADLVGDTLALISPLAAEYQVTLSSDTDELGRSAHVHADRQRLEQVLLNILANAIKYNRPGGRVDVSLALTAAGRVRITIADTGIGIEPEHLNKLYEPFERLGAELTQIEGTGLGLALSKRLLDAMGATIEVSSQLGSGTAVTIELAGAQAPGAEREPEPHESGSDGLSSVGKRHVILYIEDNLSNLTLVERILQRYPGVELIPAMQATIGLELARQHRPDLIVLDLHLPDMPGAEVLERLKREPQTREIPVIVLTADASKAQSERVRQLGAASYLTKPLDVPKFLEIIAANLAPPCPITWGRCESQPGTSTRSSSASRDCSRGWISDGPTWSACRKPRSPTMRS